MTIRSKILLSYSIALTTALVVGGASFWAIYNWRSTTENLSDMYSQEVRAERLRAEVFSQISAGLDFLNGYGDAKAQFWTSSEKVETKLEELSNYSRSEEEKDHIEGISETHFELIWTMKQIFDEGFDPDSVNQVQIAGERLREISDEVTDDVAILSQYYLGRKESNLSAAKTVGRSAAIIIAAAAILALLSLLLAIALMRRWLATPLAKISRFTRAISAGDFDTKVDISSRDEWGALARDVNNMARALKDLKQRIHVKERLATLGEVAAYTAHNIRNPLASIRAAAQVSISDLSSSESEVSKTLEEVIQTIDRLEVWVGRMLGFARPLDFRPVRSYLNEVVSTCTSLVQRLFPAKEIQLETKLESGDPVGYIDEALFEQALCSIITNAFEAAPPKGNVRVSLSLNESSNDGDFFSVEVSDNGPGMTPQVREKLFTLFESHKEGGSGLGLAQAKSIVDLHGGEINVISVEGEGTTFVMRIPLQKVIDG